jgi:hypothetical protein
VFSFFFARPRSFTLHLALGLHLLALVACAAPAPRTEILVIIDADQAVRAESVDLKVFVFGGRPETASALDVRFYREFAVTPVEGWPVELAVIPLDRDSGRLFQVEATAVDAAGGEVTAVRVRSGFVPENTFVLRLRLEDACRGVVCSSRQSCRAGACREIPMVSVEDLVRYDPDMGVGDGGMPMPMTCTTDEMCDEGNFCNGRERCLEGVCAPGERVVCDDGVACTLDVCRGNSCVADADDEACPVGPGRRCAGAMGCQYDVCTLATCSPSAATCETAVCSGTMCMRVSTCGVGETCCGGACVPAGCDDGNECTLDACSASAAGVDVCKHTARTSVCDDGNSCTLGDACGVDGTCKGAVRACDDGNPCTDDPDCVPGAGCVPVPNVAPCDDGNACTPIDRCSAGACMGTGDCDDGVACTMDVCTPERTCMRTPDSASCGTGGTCNPTTGCQFAMCDINTNCRPVDVCETTRCVGAMCVRTPVVCADSNACTDDACVAPGGCQYTSNSAPCNDGNGCTLVDVCSGGACVGSSPNPCEDGNPCTDTTCVPSTGVCSRGDVVGPCGVNDMCQSSSCLRGSCFNVAFVCPGGTSSDCTDTTCDPALGCMDTPVNEGGACCDFLPEYGRCNSGTCQPNPEGPNPMCSGPLS